MAHTDITKTHSGQNGVDNNKPKVDINILLNKVRADKKKQKYENLIFVCLVSTVIVVTGIFISL